jgi:hypothetical protein
MKIYQLNKKQYLDTMSKKMIDVTESAETFPLVWEYAEKLLLMNLLSEHDYKERFVSAVYANIDNSYHHVLLFGNKINIYAVIVINILKNMIEGHYILDLNKEYGLNEEN